MAIDVVLNKRLRGMLIDLLYGRHAAQQSRPDHVMLWHMVRDLGCDVGENELITVLQDLFDRGYVVYSEKKNRFTNRVEIALIQLTPKGRDLGERTTEDLAVQF